MVMDRTYLNDQLNPDLVRYVRKERATNPFMRIKYAAEAYRRVNAPAKHEFLERVQQWSVGDTFKGVVDGVDIAVEYVYDEDSSLGDDDCTGTFGREQKPGALQYSAYGNNGRDCGWYYPANMRTDPEAVWWDWKHNGASRQVCAEMHAASIRQDMADDADRGYIGVRVTAHVGDVEVGSASLYGIDVIERFDAREYMIDVAEECIGEAMAEARDHINEIIKAEAARSLASVAALKTAKEALFSASTH